MSDDILLENIRAEIERMVADGVDRAEAEHLAPPAVLSRMAYAQTLDPFEVRILSELEQAERDLGGKPVPTTAIATRVGVASRFTMYSYLRSLEQRGLVHRPFGRKSKAGWRVAA
jgi:DNA-binding transcriptional ArsR family regulator